MEQKTSSGRTSFRSLFLAIFLAVAFPVRAGEMFIYPQQVRMPGGTNTLAFEEYARVSLWFRANRIARDLGIKESVEKFELFTAVPLSNSFIVFGSFGTNQAYYLELEGGTPRVFNDRRGQFLGSAEHLKGKPRPKTKLNEAKAKELAETSAFDVFGISMHTLKMDFVKSERAYYEGDGKKKATPFFWVTWQDNYGDRLFIEISEATSKITHLSNGSRNTPRITQPQLKTYFDTLKPVGRE